MVEYSDKDLLKIYKTAPWEKEQDLSDFCGLLEAPPDSKLVLQMLDILSSRRFSADIGLHLKRISIFSKAVEKVSDKGLFGPIVKTLKNADPKLRSVLIATLPKVNDYEEHVRLCGLLKSPDVEMRKIGVQVLPQVGGKTVLKTLTELVQEKDFQGRSEAIDVVLPIAGHHGVPVLAAVVKLGTNQEKIKALKYLSNERYMSKATSAALKAIVPGLKDDHDKVLAQAINSFTKMCSEDEYYEYVAPMLDSSIPEIAKMAVRGLGRFSSPRVASDLERKLRGGPHVVRMEVLVACEKIGSDEILPPVVSALSNKQVAIRKRAGEVLSNLNRAGKLEVARVVIWLLHSTDVNVRRMAVEVAKSVRDPDNQLWPKLLKFLRDEDWWVRERITDALVELAGKKITPHMVSYLQDSADVVRRFAVDILIRVRDPQAIGALVSTAQNDTDWWTREKAIEGLAQLGDPRSVPYIVELMRSDEDMRFVCIQALEELDARNSAQYVAEQLQSEDPDVRLVAIKCLAAFDATSFAGDLQPLLVDPDIKVSRAAQEQLIRWNVELSEKYTTSRDKAISFLDKMLMKIAANEADDLILASNQKPYMKRMGQIVPLSSSTLSEEQVMALLTPHLSLSHMEQLNDLTDADFSYEVKTQEARFRVNVFQQHSGMSAVFRVIKGDLPELEKLGLPDVVKEFGNIKHGLVLIGGPTGSGKSTTLAALIDYINRTSDRHVISLEDPIEVVHESKRGLVNQREIGTHTRSFSAALRSTLRQDPDVILVGEMRDLDTITFAVTAAETGHLVFGTVHTVSADTSIDRVINAFPAAEQPQVRSSLSENLRAVVCQYLFKRIDKPGRVLSTEVLLNTDAVASLIRKGATYQVPSIIATSEEQGMRLMDRELMRLLKAGTISLDDAYMRAINKKEFDEIMEEQGDGFSVSISPSPSDGVEETWDEGAGRKNGAVKSTGMEN